MAKWPVSMADEQDKPPLLAEGWQEFTITEVKLVSKEESKSGNAYFLWQLHCDDGTIPMRTTLIKGKRWLLKQTLLACGIEASDSDPAKKYAFGPEDVEGKTILGNVANKTSKPFQGKDGDMITPDLKSEIVAVKKFASSKGPVFPDVSDPRQVAQDDSVPF